MTLRDRGLARRMRLPHGIDLVSNDYLGFAGHPEILERMRAALSSAELKRARMS